MTLLTIVHSGHFKAHDWLIHVSVKSGVTA